MRGANVLKVERMATSELVPYANNAKRHGERDVAAIAASIEQFGFNDPVGVWTRPDGMVEIVEGHGRVLAAKELGMEQVPVIRLDHMDDDARRAYTHVHNQTTLNTGFDWSKLDKEIGDLPEFDWGEFGFDLVGIDGFGTDFQLPDGEGPQFKSLSVQLTADQYAIVSAALDAIDRQDCVYQGGNKNGDKICEVVRQWAER
jgi:hypothetical protein